MKSWVGIIVATALVTANAWAQTEAERANLRLLATHPSAIQYDRTTGNISHLRWAEPLEPAGEHASAKALNFLEEYGAAFGLETSATTWTVERERNDLAGNHHLRLRQWHENVPVFSGFLNFHFTGDLRLAGVDGILPTGMTGRNQARLSPADAVEAALNWIGKHYPHALTTDLVVEPPQLRWFKEGLAQGIDGVAKLAYYVAVSDRRHLREYLLIDALNGWVIERYPGICDLAERKLYSGTTDHLIWQDGDAFPADLTAWQLQQLSATTETYLLFKNTFNFLSYDDLDGEMHLVDEASFLNCPNASWNGYSTNYCAAIGTDDVVAHEWGHAYTEYTSDLVYAWQAGAVNEAYSDIWGETIDILNSPPGENLPRTECQSGNRWLIAEDATVLGGAIRDLWQPTCYGKPGKVSDPEYVCGSNDYGGVHSNSGVVAHTYALLVDGGDYNGYVIEGVGLDKAAHLFWHAQAHYLGRTSNFSALADALSGAYLDLREAPLPALDLSPGGTNNTVYVLTASDSLALQAAIAATELRQDPACENYLTALAPDAPELCQEGGQAFTSVYLEDFEDGTYGWLLSAQPEHPDQWISRQWELTETLPDGRPGRGMFAANPNVGHCDTLINSGVLGLKSPSIELPPDLEGTIYLTFDHYFSIEEGDGANVKIKQGDGNWMTIPGVAFRYNPYTDILLPTGMTDNPLAGQRVFSGSDEGSVNGSWGTSQVNLSMIGVQAGETIRLRWDLGTDGCGGWEGWYVDDISIGTCATSLLPVSWLDFTAQAAQDRVLLHWSTAAEENNAGFHVERSTDAGRTFRAIGYVPSQGNSGGAYTFPDHDLPPDATLLYYRLRQSDHDGTSTYSVTVSVRVATATLPRLYPNPAADGCTLHWPNAPTTKAELTITDLAGRRVSAPTLIDPRVPFNVDVRPLPAGVYLLQLLTGHRVYTERLVVDRGR